MLGNKKKIAKVPFSCNEMTDYRKSHKKYDIPFHTWYMQCNANHRRYRTFTGKSQSPEIG